MSHVCKSEEDAAALRNFESLTVGGGADADYSRAVLREARAIFDEAVGRNPVDPAFKVSNSSSPSCFRFRFWISISR